MGHVESRQLARQRFLLPGLRVNQPPLWAVCRDIQTVILECIAILAFASITRRVKKIERIQIRVLNGREARTRNRRRRTNY
jgi:hypothetical protein